MSGATDRPADGGGGGGVGGARGAGSRGATGLGADVMAVDPDVDLRLAADRAEASAPRRWRVLAAVALGGVLGGLGRHGAARLWPTDEAGFPFALFAVNVLGCALIAVLMAWIASRHAPQPLLRPFLGVGVLGGFTSFSAYALDGTLLADADEPGVAVLYLGGTLAAALAAVWAGAVTGRWAFPPHTPHTPRTGPGEAGAAR
ncbi:CrcB family protein [Streptomyces sp. WMMC897]|nr:CrcB family protein [Streptomyces sp. WMMC897]MCZ7415297.1 CrcB family protein [Streptomyces sp. WMMC897]